MASALRLHQKCALPILFIWGNQDPAVGRYAVESQRNFIEGRFDYNELNAGHWLMEEATDQVDSTILQFLRSVDAAAAAAHGAAQPTAQPTENAAPDQPVTP